MIYKVYRTEEFDRLMGKLLTKEERTRVEGIEEDIAEKGFTGDPLKFRFLREKRISGKRIYFLIYEDLKATLMVSISDKKTQQDTIDKIRVYLPEFRKLMERLMKST